MYYPVFLNIKGRRCVVVGGGEVAERKARTLLEHDAVVTVISPSLCQGLRQMAEQGAIQVFLRDYRQGDLENTFIALAATDDPEVNAKAAREGRERGVLVNVADDAECSDFILPSLVRRGDLAIAISTGGKSPALARKIRAELEGAFGPEYASLALLLSEIRYELKERGFKVSSEAWQESLDLASLLELLRNHQSGEAKRIIIDNLRSVRGDADPSSGAESQHGAGGS